MRGIKKKAIQDVLKEALRRETEAFNYYHRASKKAPYLETESLLIQLAEEERKHRLFITKELQRIDNLLIQGTDHSFFEANEVQYSLPTDITFKGVDTSPGVDFAAVSLPVELLGGDYLDTIILNREGENPALGVFLYDVMGHGLEATNLKTLAKKVFGQLRESWIRERNLVDLNQPGEVMGVLNQKLIDKCQACRRFVSTFYGVVDPLGKTLTYTSAGHDPPILIKHGGEYIHLSETELLLGIDGDLVYSEVYVPLDVRDVLVLFSDGITEAANARQEMFERERLCRVVQRAWGASASEIILQVLDALRDFLGGEPLTDEFTLAVMKVGELRQKVERT